jgi:hypothetical protein
MVASAPKLCNVGCKSSATKELRDEEGGEPGPSFAKAIAGSGKEAGIRISRKAAKGRKAAKRSGSDREGRSAGNASGEFMGHVTIKVN